jgi:hypothetical protein
MRKVFLLPIYSSPIEISSYDRVIAILDDEIDALP